MNILGKEVVAIRRHGRVSCPNCIRDSAEHSVWHESLDTADILHDEGIRKDMVSHTPKWKDGCGHNPQAFVGSVFAYTSAAPGGQWVDVDVYVFDDPHPEGSSQQVCIRVGDEPSEYLSVGTILDLLILANNPNVASGIHHAAAAIIDQKFRIRGVRV